MTPVFEPPVSPPGPFGASIIAGIEGIHAWTPPGAGAALIELGRKLDDSGGKVWPRYEIVRISGLTSTGEPEDNRDRPPGRALEISRRSQRRGKTVTYEGLIKARTLIQLREAEAALRAAFDALATEGRMDVSWHPLYAAAESIPPKFYEARALTCEIAEVQEGERWDRSYVVGLRMGDRRYFDAEIHTASASITETEVGASTMFTFPLIARGPVLRLEVPAVAESIGVTVLNVTTGKSLTLNMPEGWSGADLILDFDAQTIVDTGGTDRSAFLSPTDISLWKAATPIVTGSNEIEITAAPLTIHSVTSTPGTVADSSVIGSSAWSNPERAKLTGSILATETALAIVGSGATSHYLEPTDFGFSVPTSAVITGALASLKTRCPTHEIKDTDVRLSKGGTIEGSNRFAGADWMSGEVLVERSWGGSSDLWGLALTPSDVNATNFGYGVSITGKGAANANAAAMRVYYRETGVSYAAKATLTWEQGYI